MQRHISNVSRYSARQSRTTKNIIASVSARQSANQSKLYHEPNKAEVVSYTNGIEEVVSCVVWCLVCGVECGHARHQSSIAIRSGVGSSWHASAIFCASRHVMPSGDVPEPPGPGGTRAESERDNAASGFSIILSLCLLLIFIIVVIIVIIIIIAIYHAECINIQG